jgi:H/ACA ribonucleoprotein complex subunit 2
MPHSTQTRPRRHTSPRAQELGASALSKRPTSCMLILPKPAKAVASAGDDAEFDEAYAEVEKKVKASEVV